MSHNPNYWMYQPRPADADSAPSVREWTLHKGTDMLPDLSCEVQLFKNGELASAAVFKTRALAAQWASQERQRLIRRGCHALDVG